MKLLKQNKMKQTAVEFMVEEFKDTILKEYGEGRFLELIEQAKDMEKEQIIALAAELYEDMFGIDGKEYAIDYYNKLKQ